MSRRPIVIALSLLGLALAIALVHSRLSRARARSLALAAHAAASRLDECIGSRDQLRLAFPDDRPAASCAEPAKELSASARELARGSYLADPARARELAGLSEKLARAKWDATARDLSSASLETFAETRNARALTQALVIAEGASASETASPRPSMQPPEPTEVLDRELPEEIVELDWTPIASGKAAWISLELRTKTRRRAWLVRSADNGKTWQRYELDPAGKLHVASLPGGAVAVAAFSENEVWLWRIAPGTTRPEPLGEQPITVPPGHTPLSTGSSLLALADGSLALVLAGSDGQARIGYAPFDAGTWRTAPAGRLLAATSGAPARLILARSSKTGFVQLAQLALPKKAEPWPEASTSLISYVAELTPAPGPDRSCGLVFEPYFSWLGRGPKDGVLIAAGPKQIYPFRFSPSPKSEVAISCGTCPPAALERSADGLRILPPVRRQLAPSRVTTPLAFEPRSAATAVSTCTAEQTVVAYVADERVLAQATRGGTWRFDHPRVVAEPSSLGAPIEVRALGFEARTLILWRRALPRSRRVRIEAAEMPR